MADSFQGGFFKMKKKKKKKKEKKKKKPEINYLIFYQNSKKITPITFPIPFKKTPF